MEVEKAVGEGGGGGGSFEHILYLAVYLFCPSNILSSTFFVLSSLPLVPLVVCFHRFKSFAWRVV